MKNVIYMCIAIVLSCLFVKTYAWTPFSPILLFKEGINWVQMIGGISVPVDLKEETVTIGSAVKAYYLLPTNLSDPQSSRHNRKRRQEFPRQNIYTYIDNIHNKTRKGEIKSCFLKIICEYAAHPVANHSLLSQLLGVLLRPSRLTDEIIGDDYMEAEMKGYANFNCSSLFPECKTNFLSSLNFI
ncbi:hypothetical protein WA026_010652 [Henosepilachna vigintioctopunctata]|uniref:Uncharacterized protein n=1 Tax=Henosepilachna vigintioctopunctata TaxID=420089 RepID=A0AAW1UWC0_9CUCU